MAFTKETKHRKKKEKDVKFPKENCAVIFNILVVRKRLSLA